MRGLGAASLMALGGCLPGPWDYVPNGAPTFRGVTATAYAVAGRPAEDVCFERLLDLKEGSTDARAWFDSASVGITGQFSNGGQTVALQPKPGAVNCFAGPAGTRFLRGQSYTLTARIVWDSAGRQVVSTLTSTARVPASFSIRDTAYAPRAALLGVANIDPADPASRFVEPYVDGDSIYYMAAGQNFSELSHFFLARRSPDVRAVLITRRFDSTAARPENSFDIIPGLESELPDFYQKGTLNRLIIYPDAPIDGRNVLDSMGVVNAWFWTGKNRLYFYGAEQIYRDYQDALEESQQNAKIRLPSNVTGGRGFFAGMVVDSFDVNIRLDGKTKAYPLSQSRPAACRQRGWFGERDCIGIYRSFCKDTAWSTSDCRLDAVYTLLNPVDSVLAPAWLPDSVSAWTLLDTSLAPKANRRFCIENNYPSGTRAGCAALKTECDASGPENPCKRALWQRCELAYWNSTALPACAQGLRTYCANKRDIQRVLCRDVPNP